MNKYGNPSAWIEAQWDSAPHVYLTGDMLILRLLVEQGPAELAVSSFRQVLDASVAIIQTDFDDFEVVGVTVDPVLGGETIGDKIIADTGAYIVDLVFRALNWENVYFSAGDYTIAGAQALGAAGFASFPGGRPKVTYLAGGSLNTNKGNYLQAALNAWGNTAPLLTQKKGMQSPERGAALEAGYRVKPYTWGKQLSFGLADYPERLEPIKGEGLLTTGKDGGGSVPNPLFKWLGSGQKMSTDNLLVWGLFAVGGAVLAHQAYKAWK
jgi:hypothetical protein